MAEPVNNKTLGGLTYNANLVSSAKKLQNGKFEITFKTGEKLTYPQQKDFELIGVDWFNGDKLFVAKTGEKIPADGMNNMSASAPRNAKITQHIDEGLIYDDTHFNISNVMGATFTSSKDTVSHVKLNNSSNTTIDLAANDSKWYGDDAEIVGGKNNRVILDKNDEAKIAYKKIDGEGTASQKDYE